METTWFCGKLVAPEMDLPSHTQTLGCETLNVSKGFLGKPPEYHQTLFGGKLRDGSRPFWYQRHPFFAPMCEAAAITLLGSLGLAWTPQGNRKRSTGNDKGWELVCLLIHREAESIDGDGNHVHSPQFCPKQGADISLNLMSREPGNPYGGCLMVSPFQGYFWS